MPNLKAKECKKFEDIKYVRQDGSVYWSVRELSDVLNYSHWRNFKRLLIEQWLRVRIAVMK